MVAARIIYILWLTLAFTCITILWPRNDLQRFLAYAQLGLISSLAIFKSGIEWQQNRFISQRLWLLLPVLIFHVYTILNHSFLIELPFLDIILLSTGILGLVYVVFIGWVNRDSIKKNARIILSFSLPMMLNLALTAGVELKMKTTLQASLSGREWSVFSLGLFAYAIHGLIGNNLAPMLNAWLKRNMNYFGRLKLILGSLIVIIVLLFLVHSLQVLIISMFDIWYFLYSFSILLWLATNILSVQLLNSKIIMIFGIIQFLGYLVASTELNISYYILIHLIASSAALIFALNRLQKNLKLV